MKPSRFYDEMLRETLADVESARDAGNYTAVAALRRRAQDAREKLDEAIAAESAHVTLDTDPYAGAPDAKLEAILIETIAELPVAVVVRIQAAIDERMGAQAKGP